MRPLLLALALLAGLSATPALAQNRFWLINQAGLTIEHAYVSPSRLSDWGNDILVGTLVKPGEQVRVTPSAKDCVLDIKVEYAGGQAEEKMEVDACRVDRIVFTNPQGRAEGPGGTMELATDSPGGQISREAEEEGALSFAFLNRSGETIREFYVLPSRDGDGGGAPLGRTTLADGRRQRVALAGRSGCAVGIRVASEGRLSQERRHATACDRPEIAWP